jgi:hypothetical protein
VQSQEFPFNADWLLHLVQLPVVLSAATHPAMPLTPKSAGATEVTTGTETGDGAAENQNELVKASERRFLDLLE